MFFFLIDKKNLKKMKQNKYFNNIINLETKNGLDETLSKAKNEFSFKN